MKDVLEKYHTIDDTLELNNALQEMIKKERPDMKIGYIDLFNMTVKATKRLTFPYYSSDYRKHMKKLHTYQAITANMFVECDFDYVLINQGLEGIGKSSYSLDIIEELRKLGKEYDPKRDMITKSWEYNDVENLISESKNSIIYFDEGKKFFDLRRSMMPDRIDMLEFFTTERWRRNIYIIAVSDLTEIDKYFRERRAKAITLIPDRGLAFMLHSVNLFGVGQDRFHLERFEQMISTDRNAMNFERQLSLIMSLPTCYGMGLTQPIFGERWDEYYNLKIRPPKEKEDKKKKDKAQTGIEEHL